MNKEMAEEVQTFVLDKNMTVVENTLVICSEDGTRQSYIPFSSSDGQVLLKIVNEKGKRVLREEPKPKEKKPLSYETEFKPCNLPANKGGGGIKGLIRYGKKHLIIDQQTMISPREFKLQLENTKDIIMYPEPALCTKQQMRHMLTGITRLFAYPAHKMPCDKLLNLYVTNCSSREQSNVETITDMQLMPVGYQEPIDQSKIKRITRKRRHPEIEEHEAEQETVYILEEPAEEIVYLMTDDENFDHAYTKRMDPGVQNIYVIDN